MILLSSDQYQNLSKNKKHKYKTEDYKQALLDSGAELTITNDLSLFYSDTLEYMTKELIEGLKSFKCEHCEKAFHHRIRHHGSKPKKIAERPYQMLHFFFFLTI